MKLSVSALGDNRKLVEPIFQAKEARLQYDLYKQGIQESLGRIFRQMSQEKVFDDALHLPLIVAIGSRTDPGEVSFYSVSPYRADSFKFFFEIIIHSLLPGKRLNVLLLNAVDFRFSDTPDSIFTLCEVVVNVEDLNDIRALWNSWSTIERQLRLGLESEFYARRILEIKGLSNDEKAGMILRDLAYVLKRKPYAFDQHLLADMQYFLVVCSDEFKNHRSCRHMSRLIAVQYYFRHALKKLNKDDPYKRHFMLKLFKVNTQKAKTLGVIVGVNLIKEREKFEKRHLLKAIQAYIPSVKVVDESFYVLRQTSENVCTLYCEVEKEEGNDFTDQEIRLLRRELPKALERRVEHLMHPVFMPRNEEEIYRNILMLGSQIKYLRDIPQVTISFDEQSHKHLYFTVILVRVLKGDDPTIQQFFLSQSSTLVYIHDRSQYVGSLRRKHKKEATVFRVKLPKDAFLRSDYTLDLNKARQSVFNELTRIIGELRDFNGGMIAKQNEVLRNLQVSLEAEKGYNELLLENFFYSLTPVILRNIFDLDLLKSLYRLLVESIEDVADFDQSYSLKVCTNENTVFAMIKTQERGIKDELSKALDKLQVPSSSLASMYLSDYDVVYIGYIYRQQDPVEQRRFCQTVEYALASWKLKKNGADPKTVIW